MKSLFARLQAHPEGYGFVVGMACLALTAGAYRLTWELPKNPMPNQQDLVMPQTSSTEPETEEQAVSGTRRTSLPLQRVDPPPQAQHPLPPPTAAPPPPAQPSGPPKPVSLRRSAPQRGYAPGVPVDIQVTIDKGDEADVQMLVLEEKLPPGWTFLHLECPAPPDMAPAPNAGDTLQFTWKEPPAFPLSLRYSLMPNPQNTAPQTLRAKLTYQAGGTARTSPVAALMLRPIAAP